MYRDKHKKREYSHDYYQENKGELLEQQRERRQEQRAAAMQLLGGKCVHCGFSDWRALQIDHVHGGGHAEIRRLGSTWRMYQRVQKHLEDYQLLCVNCNWIKRYEKKEHNA